MEVKIDEHFFSERKVTYYFNAAFSYLDKIVDKQKTVLITDEQVFEKQQGRFEGWQTIVIKAGEAYKQQSTVDFILTRLIALEADRKTTIVGIGGGVVTDTTGYAAGIYMRGVKFGFVPTTILAMVDASIGGKNGVDIGVYKNLAGLIRQPEFLLFDYNLLQTLPHRHWVNGFAEIIKHACIKDAELFAFLEQHSIESFKTDLHLLAQLVEKNVGIKTQVVLKDEFEQGDRKLLNFGHTLGHAIENKYELLHGHAISIGMIAAANISVRINQLEPKAAERIKALLQQYSLPVDFVFETDAIWEVLKMDKKRAGADMNFVLLNKIGEAIIKAIPVNSLKALIN